MVELVLLLLLSKPRSHPAPALGQHSGEISSSLLGVPAAANSALIGLFGCLTKGIHCFVAATYVPRPSI